MTKGCSDLELAVSFRGELYPMDGFPWEER